MPFDRDGRWYPPGGWGALQRAATLPPPPETPIPVEPPPPGRLGNLAERLRAALRIRETPADLLPVIAPMPVADLAETPTPLPAVTPPLVRPPTPVAPAPPARPLLPLVTAPVDTLARDWEAPEPQMHGFNVPADWLARQAAAARAGAPMTLPAQAAASLQAGIGDVLATAGGAARWLGAAELGERLGQAGRARQEQYALPTQPFTWRRLLDPNFFASTVVRTLPFSLSLLPVALTAGYAAGAAAGAVKLGAFGRLALQAVGGGTMQRALESAMEAGSVYEEALRQGMTAEQAETAADRTFRNNLLLAGMDVAQMAMLFAPLPKGTLAGRVLSGLRRMPAIGVTEAGEEIIQNYIQRRALGSTETFGQMLRTPEMQEAAVIGLIHGTGLGGLGTAVQALTTMQDRVLGALPPSARATVQTLQAQGMPEQQAKLAVLDRVAETEAGRALVEAAAREVVGRTREAERVVLEAGLGEIEAMGAVPTPGVAVARPIPGWEGEPIDLGPVIAEENRRQTERILGALRRLETGPERYAGEMEQAVPTPRDRPTVPPVAPVVTEGYWDVTTDPATVLTPTDRPLPPLDVGQRRARTAPAPPPPATGNQVNLTGEEVEIIFRQRPSEAVLRTLPRTEFTWDSYTRSWRAARTPETEARAWQLAGLPVPGTVDPIALGPPFRWQLPVESPYLALAPGRTPQPPPAAPVRPAAAPTPPAAARARVVPPVTPAQQTTPTPATPFVPQPGQRVQAEGLMQFEIQAVEPDRVRRSIVVDSRGRPVPPEQIQSEWVPIAWFQGKNWRLVEGVTPTAPPPPVTRVVPPEAVRPTDAEQMTQAEVVEALRQKGFDGTIDRLERGVIDLEQARGELVGTVRPQVEVPTLPSAADFAAELKGQGVGRRESWSRWVQRTALNPGMDAKDWYAIYDAVTPVTQPVTPPVAAVTPAVVEPVGEAPTPIAEGATSTAMTEAGMRVDTRFALVEAVDLLTSHDSALRLDARYPAVLQPRDRGRLASEAQVHHIASTLAPERLGANPMASDGAPVVGPDLIVEAGNARVIALKRLYERGEPNARVYRQWLAENAETFGLDRAAIEAAQAPVLVRIRLTEVDRAEFARQANVPTVAAMSATEQALVDARLLTDGLMGMFEPGENGELLVTSNLPFIRAFNQNIIGEAERGQYMTRDGEVSQAGLNRIRNAVFARAYGDPAAIERLAEDLDDNVRRITAAMLVAAPRLARIKAGMAQGRLHNLDLTANIAEAMNELSALREQRHSVPLYLQQVPLPGQGIPALSREVLRVLHAHATSTKRLTEILQSYADLVEELGDPRQLKMIAGPVPTVAEAWKATVRKVEKDHGVQSPVLEDPGTRRQEITQDVGRARPQAREAEDAVGTVPPAVGRAAPAPPGPVTPAAPGAPAAPTLGQLEARFAEAVKEEVGEVVPPIGLSVRVVGEAPDPTAARQFTFDDPELERVHQATHGIVPQTRLERIRARVDQMYRQATREYEHLPRTPEFQPLRTELTRLSKQRNVQASKTVRLLRGILLDIRKNPEAFNLFERKVLLQDLREEVERGHPLPNQWTPEQVKTQLARVEAAMQAHPAVQKALDTRREVWAALKAEYIPAMAAIDFDAAGRFTREDYFRHQVLEHARQKGTLGLGGGVETPARRGWLQRREGGNYLMNTSYLEAEFEVMAQMKYDIEIARTIKLVDDQYNIMRDLKERVRETNHTRIMAHFEQLAHEANRGVTDVKKLVTAEQLYRRTLNKKQAMGFDKLARLAEAEILPGVGEAKWDRVLTALAENSQDPETMGYLAWLLQAHRDTEAGQAAALVFKGIHEKQEYIRQALGKEFVSWEDLVPEGYQSWQPRKGSIFYLTDSVSERLAKQIMEGSLETTDISPSDLRRVLAVGGLRTQFIVKDEVATTLEQLGQRMPRGAVGQMFEQAVGGWKAWHVLGPLGVARHTIRNVSGDAEAMFLGNPSAFRKVPQAVKELYSYIYGKTDATGHLSDFLDRGAMESTFQAAELAGISELEVFMEMQVRKPPDVAARTLKSYWQGSRKFADFRENILRYAAYLDFMEQMEGNNGIPRSWGASDPDLVMALPNLKDRAFMMSNQLLGAYDEVSVFTQHARRGVLPFFSFQEVNAKRYVQLMKNVALDMKATEGLGRKTLVGLKRSPFLALKAGGFMIRATALWGLLHAYNSLRFPEEQRELGRAIKRRPYIILGRDEDGIINYFTRLGILDDFLEWFGPDSSRKAVQDLLDGRIGLSEAAREMFVVGPPKGIANKLVQGLGPLKTGVEVATGKSFFPDMFNPRGIRDRALFMARSVRLGDLYIAIAGLPQRSYGDILSTILYFKDDPGESAYWDMRDLVRDFQKRIGKAGFQAVVFSPRSNALYNLRMAMRFEDKQAMEKYFTEYMNLGGTMDGLATSLRNMHPLHGLTRQEQEVFVATLDAEALFRLYQALVFFEGVLGDPDARPR